MYDNNWLQNEKDRLKRLGLESGQRLIFHFEKDPRKDWVENLGRFERPIINSTELPVKSMPIKFKTPQERLKQFKEGNATNRF